MKQITKTAENSKLNLKSANNDNAPIGANLEILAENEGVCAQTPICGQFENLGIQSANTSASQEKPRVTVFSNLPENLPILKSEILLIRGFMGELVNSILANDNEFE